MAEQPTPAEATPAGPEAARLDLRTAGYCAYCDRFVERASGGGCAEGHPAEAMFGRVVLDAEEPLPKLPRFNVAAFALPPVWGPAHGQWAGVFFLPIWLFVDSIIASAKRGPIETVAAVLIAAATLAFQLFFAYKANGVAWRRVCDRQTVAEFRAAQRRWAYVCVPAGAALLVWAAWFRVTH